MVGYDCEKATKRRVERRKVRTKGKSKVSSPKTVARNIQYLTNETRPTVSFLPSFKGT